VQDKVPTMLWTTG
nr:immunoglobulin heavy chain junction region [Mus musculus]